MALKSSLKNTVFVTYFDQGYIPRGVALFESLSRHAPGVQLWVIAFDKYTEKVLNKLKLTGLVVIPLREFEDRALLKVKRTRSKVEYMWTSTPSIPLYIFNKDRNVKYVVYVDADEYFFSSPMRILEESSGGSIYAVEHRYPKGREGLNVTDGRFNVAINVFKRSNVAFKCLRRWRNQCLEWCYWRLEDGKLGDQMYLNEWPKLYGKDLTISKNIGVNVAPWNVSQYKISSRGGNVYVNGKPIVCYHFHQFQIFSENKFNRVYGYRLSKPVIDSIYEPYENELKEVIRKIKIAYPNFKIKPPVRYSFQIIRQMLGKYFGPLYWRFITLIHK